MYVCLCAPGRQHYDTHTHTNTNAHKPTHNNILSHTHTYRQGPHKPRDSHERQRFHDAPSLRQHMFHICARVRVCAHKNALAYACTHILARYGADMRRSSKCPSTSVICIATAAHAHTHTHSSHEQHERNGNATQHTQTETKKNKTKTRLPAQCVRSMCVFLSDSQHTRNTQHKHSLTPCMRREMRT